MENLKFIKTIKDPNSIITPIDSAIRFPEILGILLKKYEDDIRLFCTLIANASTSGELLEKIRSTEFDANTRMSLLKMFRRCVSPVLDTETTKKISKVSTDSLVENYGHTFKPIAVLKEQFKNISQDQLAALAALIGEYDTRGQLGYQLTDLFFKQFEERFAGIYTIEGPRGAGRDIELKSLFPTYVGNFPCDFVIKNKSQDILAVGFARYDSTRGGAQSDDRTGGNANKVDKAKEFFASIQKNVRIIFLSDGPGIAHKDTWQETCDLDGSWDGNVRVVTLKTIDSRITAEWLDQKG